MGAGQATFRSIVSMAGSAQENCDCEICHRAHLEQHQHQQQHQHPHPHKHHHSNQHLHKHPNPNPNPSQTGNQSSKDELGSSAIANKSAKTANSEPEEPAKAAQQQPAEQKSPKQQQQQRQAADGAQDKKEEAPVGRPDDNKTLKEKQLGGPVEHAAAELRQHFSPKQGLKQAEERQPESAPAKTVAGQQPKAVGKTTDRAHEETQSHGSAPVAKEAACCPEEPRAQPEPESQPQQQTVNGPSGGADELKCTQCCPLHCPRQQDQELADEHSGRELGPEPDELGEPSSSDGRARRPRRRRARGRRARRQGARTREPMGQNNGRQRRGSGANRARRASFQ